MDIFTAFSTRINELICESGLSLDELSKATGISVFTLFHLKSRKNPKLPSTNILLKLANYFKCSFAFILGTEEVNTLPNPRIELPEFSDNFKAILDKRKLKIFLMKKSGLLKEFPSFYNWISGKYVPNVYNLIRLSEMLDCSVDFLLGREN